MQPELEAQGFSAGRDRIVRLRRELALRCKQKRKFKSSTRYRRGLALSGRHQGRLHLTATALWKGVRNKRPAPGLIHHSDRGSQYCAHDYQKLVKQFGMQSSMSRRGNCYDNAPMESFWGSLKNKLVHHQRYATRADAKAAIQEYIESFYNRQRRHSRLGNVPPALFAEKFSKRQMMQERGVSVDHSSVNRWAMRFLPLIGKMVWRRHSATPARNASTISETGAGSQVSARQDAVARIARQGHHAVWAGAGAARNTAAQCCPIQKNGKAGPPATARRHHFLMQGQSRRMLHPALVAATSPGPSRYRRRQSCPARCQAGPSGRRWQMRHHSDRCRQLLRSAAPASGAARECDRARTPAHSGHGRTGGPPEDRHAGRA
ncbi:IS3 family transposase [Massilia violaceinigra]|uniref:IS3 family transposase n=1 Tax=Massilia violaceinigra TaxID=2045208 RepID=A0ABY4A5V2_9BURK|nr:IS3 family transposase [Massilia violaceinigra]